MNPQVRPHAAVEARQPTMTHLRKLAEHSRAIFAPFSRHRRAIGRFEMARALVTLRAGRAEQTLLTLQRVAWSQGWGGDGHRR